MGEHDLSRCRGCGAPLEGNFKKRKIKCPYCGAVNIVEKQTVSDSEITCPQCGTVNKKESEHCVECGHNLYYACPKCGTRNEANAIHCLKCGINLEEVAAKQKQDELRKQETLAKKKSQRKKNVKSFFIYLAVVLILFATVMVARFIHEQSPEQQALRATQTEETYREPWLGINWYVMMNEDIARAMNVDKSTEGILVLQVYADSPAQAAGITAGTTIYEDPDLGEIPIGGDIITMVNGEPVADLDINYLWDLDYEYAGDNMKLTILRNSETFVLNVTLGKKPRWIDREFEILNQTPFGWFTETGNFGIAAYPILKKSSNEFLFSFTGMNYTEKEGCKLDLSQISIVDDLGNTYSSSLDTDQQYKYMYTYSYFDLKFTPALAEEATSLTINFPVTCGISDIYIPVDLLSSSLTIEYY